MHTERTGIYSPVVIRVKFITGLYYREIRICIFTGCLDTSFFLSLYFFPSRPGVRGSILLRVFYVMKLLAPTANMLSHALYNFSLLVSSRYCLEYFLSSRALLI